MAMQKTVELLEGKTHFRREKEGERCIQLDLNIEAIEIDLTRPRLIRVVGRTSKGGLVERHMKITEKERLVMV